MIFFNVFVLADDLKYAVSLFQTAANSFMSSISSANKKKFVWKTVIFCLKFVILLNVIKIFLWYISGSNFIQAFEEDERYDAKKKEVRHLLYWCIILIIFVNFYICLDINSH